MLYLFHPDRADLSGLPEEIQFTAARASFLAVCKEWSSFHVKGREAALFCRLVGSDSDGRPTGFCLLRPVFPSKSLAVLQFAVFGASQLHMDQEFEAFSRCAQNRGAFMKVNGAFLPALLWDTGDTTALQSVLPSVQLFSGPAAPRLAAMQWYRTWRWTITDTTLRGTLLGLMRRHRLVDGFFVLSWSAGAFVIEIAEEDSHPTHQLVQWRGSESGDDLVAEVWGEPIYGWGQHRFELLTEHLRASDERVVQVLSPSRVLRVRTLTHPLILCELHRSFIRGESSSTRWKVESLCVCVRACVCVCVRVCDDTTFCADSPCV